MSINLDVSEQPTVAIAVTLVGNERDRATIQQIVQPFGRPVAKRLLLRAAALVRFGSIDTCDAYLLAVEVEGIAVDDAVQRSAGATEVEASAEAGGGRRIRPDNAVASRQLVGKPASDHAEGKQGANAD